MRFSEAASIGIHAMILMAGSRGEPVTCRDVSDSFGTSLNHTQKVMRRLVKAGLARSGRGPRGGYRICGNPSDISLLAVYEALDGPIGTDTCLFQKRHCTPETCLLGKMLWEAGEVARTHLSETSLAEFARGEGRKGK